MKTFYQVLASILVVSSLEHAYATSVCTSTEVGRHVVDLNLNGRKLTVIGWSHPTDADAQIVNEFLVLAMQAAEKRDCATAQKALLEISAKLPGLIRSHHSVSDQLAAANSKNHLSNVGLELSPDELQESWQRLEGRRQQALKLKDLCGEPVGTVFETIREILQGPEVTFANKLQGVVSLIPLEDTMTKREAEVAYTKAIPFNDRDPRIDIFSGIALSTIWQNILDQKVPTRALMASAVFYLKDEHERRQALSDLDESVKVLKERISWAYARDVWIVQNALKLSGNTAIVVGYNHVADLNSKFISQCEHELPVP